jgi:hypothetical protein
MIIDILGNLSIFPFLFTIVPIKERKVSIKERKPKMVRRRISKETIAIAKRVAIDISNSGTLSCSCTSPNIDAWAGTTNISDSTNMAAESDNIVLFITELNDKVTNAI